ncbi:hypothetical protein ACVW0P_002262 [Mucilaginibacter sp. UYNi724]
MIFLWHARITSNGWNCFTVAHVHDSKAVIFLMRILKDMLCSIRVIIADGGYRGEIADQIKNKFGYIIQVVMRTDEKID